MGNRRSESAVYFSDLGAEEPSKCTRNAAVRLICAGGGHFLEALGQTCPTTKDHLQPHHILLNGQKASTCHHL